MKDLIKKIWAWLKLAFGRGEDTIKYIFVDNTSNWKIIELEILRQMNIYRVENGLGILTGDFGIREETKLRCDYMLDTGVLSHDGFSDSSRRLKDKGLKSVGEIIGYGYSEASSVMHAWKNSPGHNRLMLTSRYTHIGVSTIVKRGDTKFFCVIFGR
tara:strand:+ start:174631 stop:175101 length:471 start_codon:yes stop_codon:yes gene_type:complete